ncbi:MAG: hypothetical protein OCD01_12060 [Fibrobacterales bacterium]
MNKYFGLLAVLLFLGCESIPGPWEYSPEAEEPYNGLYVTATLIADRPVTEVYVEMLHELNEVRTPYFNFYDSASVSLTHNGVQYPLTSSDDIANSFVSDSGLIILRGEVYTLAGSIWWDSLGTQVVTTFSAETQVPGMFDLKDTANLTLPSLAPKPVDSTGYIQWFSLLDSRIQIELLTIFQSELLVLYADLLPQIYDETGQPDFEKIPQLLQQNPERLIQFMEENLDSIYDEAVRIDGTLEKVSYYTRGDTINYLYGTQNTSQHIYPTTYSDDVESVLITHAFDDSASTFPKNAFDLEQFVGIPSTAADYYYNGNLRRLIIYPQQESPSGGLLLDNIAVFNIWYVGGYNKVYFYAYDREYYKYVDGTIMAESDTKTPPVFNINGARGFFSSAIVDSFEFVVRIDSTEDYFTREETIVDRCSKDWGDTQRCREYLEPWCESIRFTNEVCHPVFVAQKLDGYLDTIEFSQLLVTWEEELDSVWQVPVDSIMAFDSVTQALPENNEIMERNTYLIQYSKLEYSVDEGFNRYCLNENYLSPLCDSIKTKAWNTNQNSIEKDQLFDYCSDKQWDMTLFPQCGPGLVLYVEQLKKEGRYSRVLEKEAAQYCVENPQQTVCIQ